MKCVPVQSGPVDLTAVVGRTAEERNEIFFVGFSSFAQSTEWFKCGWMLDGRYVREESNDGQPQWRKASLEGDPEQDMVLKKAPAGKKGWVIRTESDDLWHANFRGFSVVNESVFFTDGSLPAQDGWKIRPDNFKKTHVELP